MRNFIPKEKLSKKKKKELNNEARISWGFTPASRVKKSAKIYNRKRLDRDDYSGGPFFLHKSKAPSVEERALQSIV